MTEPIQYFAIPLCDYQKLIEATSRPEMVKVETACTMFDISENLLTDLVNEGRLKRYGIPGRPRTTHFKISDLQNLFKPI